MSYRSPDPPPSLSAYSLAQLSAEARRRGCLLISPSASTSYCPHERELTTHESHWTMDPRLPDGWEHVTNARRFSNLPSPKGYSDE